MSPLYETDADRAREHGVATELARHFGVTAHRFPPRFELDYFLERDGDLAGFLEVKCRRIAFGQYDGGFMFDLTKWEALVNMGQRWKAAAILGVSFTDRVAWVDLMLAPIEHRNIGGRNDRGDARDRDLVCYVAWSQFRPIGATV